MDEDEVEKILSLLKVTYSGENTLNIYNAEKEIKKIIEKDIKKYVKIFIHFLSLDSVQNYNIPLELHISIAIYLKKIFKSYINELESNILTYLNEIILLLITNTNNSNLNNYILFNNCLNLIEYLLYSNSIMSNDDNIKSLFKLLYNYISLNQNKTNIEINLKLLLLNNTFLRSKAVNKENFLLLFNEYYLAILDVIKNNLANFINNENKDKIKLIVLLKYFFKGLNNSIFKTKLIFNLLN